MHEQVALHTAARCYCLEQAPGLDPQREEQWYCDRRWKRRNPELIDVLARSRGTSAQLDFLGELLFQIEQRIPADFPSIDALRSSLIELASNALSICEDADAEYERECTLFQQYIQSLSEQDLRAVAPLPYRRVLGEHEQANIWQRVQDRWGITPKMHWYPLSNGPRPSHVIALEEDWFAYHIPPDVLREILRQHGIERLWELRMGPVPSQYRMDVARFVATPDPLEQCWTSGRLDWLIYTSHEHSITLGGQWLVQEVKRRWPTWYEHIYAGYEYDLPPPWEKP
jgi:hypothetical protein